MKSPVILVTFFFLVGLAATQPVYVIKNPHFKTSPTPCEAPLATSGNLAIESTPPGAEIYINHIYAGTAPICISGLQPGRYLVRLNLTTDYLPYQNEVKVKAGETTTLQAPMEEKARVWFAKGKASMKTGNEAEALQDFQNAAMGKPKPIVQGFFMTGLLLFNRKKWEAAAHAFRQFAFYHPESAATFHYLGQAYENLGEEQKAFTAYKIAALNLPNLKGVLHAPPGSTWGEINQIKQKLETNPNDLADRVRLGYLYGMKGKFREGITQFKEVLSRSTAALEQEQTGWEALYAQK